MKKFPAFLILVLIIILPSILSAQGSTVKIIIVDKQYIPPGRTPKIPQEFKTQGARLVVRAGDVVKICNADKLFAKPMSLSKENKFQGLSGSGGLRPGDCITIKAQNAGNKPIPFWLHDEIHARAKIFMVVLPANWPNEGEEDTPPAPAYSPNDKFRMTEGGEVINDDPRKKPCSAAESKSFSQMVGTWKSYALKLTIKGSCDDVHGSMEWVEWCSGVDDKINNYQKYPGDFEGSMSGSTLTLKWSIPALGPHPKQSGTAYVSVKGDGVNVSGFGCGHGQLKKE